MAGVIESGRVRIWMDQAVKAWVGYTLPSAEQAVAESEWEEDGRGRYCPSCGEIVGIGEVVVVGGLRGRAVCGSCRGKRLPFRGFVRLGSYAGPLRDWVLAIKYHSWSEMATFLGGRLGAQVRRSGVVDLKRAVVVPMPMPWQRRLYRGMDHADTIAQAVAKEIGAPLARVLAKRNGAPQVSLPLSRRKLNLRRRIRIRNRLVSWDLSGMHAILVDDVSTTGASIREAAKVLRRLGPERIIAAVLAVTDGPVRLVPAAEAFEDRDGPNGMDHAGKAGVQTECRTGVCTAVLDAVSATGEVGSGVIRIFNESRAKTKESPLP